MSRIRLPAPFLDRLPRGPGMVVLVCIVAGAGILRVSVIRVSSLWLDEIGQVVTAGLPLHSMLATVRSMAGAAPLDYFGVRAVTAVLGHGTTASRMWSLLVGIAAVALAARATSLITHDRVAGWYSAGLMAVAPVAVYYSVEARPYALAMAASLAIVVAYATATRSHRRRDWIVLGLTFAVGVYTHYFVVLMAALVAVFEAGRWLAGRRGDLPGIVLASATGGALFLPWAMYALPSQLGRHFYWVVPPLDIPTWLGQYVALLELRRWSGWQDGVPWVTILLLLLALVGVVVELRRANWLVLLPASLAVAIVPFGWLLSTRSGYEFTARQLIIALPMLLLLIGPCLGWIHRGMTRFIQLPEFQRRLTAALVPLPLVLTSVPGLGRVTSGQYFQKEDWRGAASYIAAQLCPSATVYSNLSRAYDYGVGFYRGTLLDRGAWLYTSAHESETESVQEAVAHRALGPSDVVVVLPYLGGPNSPNVRGLGAMRASLKDRGWVELIFAGPLFVYTRGAGCR